MSRLSSSSACWRVMADPIELPCLLHTLSASPWDAELAMQAEGPAPQCPASPPTPDRGAALFHHPSACKAAGVGQAGLECPVPRQPVSSPSCPTFCCPLLSYPRRCLGWQGGCLPPGPACEGGSCRGAAASRETRVTSGSWSARDGTGKCWCGAVTSRSAG